MSLAPWIVRYFIQETDNLNGRIDFSSLSNSIGTHNQGPKDLFGIPVTGMPLGSAQNIYYPDPLSNESSSYYFDEIMKGIKNPLNLNFSLIPNVYHLKFFLANLMQNIYYSSEGTYSIGLANYYKSRASIYSYIDFPIKKFLSLLISLNNLLPKEDYQSWEYYGSIIDGVSFSGEEGGLTKLSLSLRSTRMQRYNVLGYYSGEQRLYFRGSAGVIPSDLKLLYEASPNNWIEFGTSMTIVDSEEDFSDPRDLQVNSFEISRDTGAINLSKVDSENYQGYFIGVSYEGESCRNKFYSSQPIEFGINEEPIKFQDLFFEIEYNQVKCRKFNLTLNNNPTIDYYNEDKANRIKLGRLTGTLNLEVSWSDSSFGGIKSLRSYLLKKKVRVKISNSLTMDEPNDFYFQLFGQIKELKLTQAKEEIFSDLTIELISDIANGPCYFQSVYLSGYQGTKVVSNYIYVSDSSSQAYLGVKSGIKAISEVSPNLHKRTNESSYIYGNNHNYFNIKVKKLASLDIQGISSMGVGSSNFKRMLSSIQSNSDIFGILTGGSIGNMIEMTGSISSISGIQSTLEISKSAITSRIIHI